MMHTAFGWRWGVVLCAMTAAASAQNAGQVLFNAPRVFAGGTNYIVTADFNGDGKLDMAAIRFPIQPFVGFD